MNNLMEIKGRLRSVGKTRQIMGAMKMVATVKLRRIQAAVQAGRSYARSLEALIGSVLASEDGRTLRHPLLARRSVHKVLWLVISTDRGLCGSLNTSLFRFVMQALRERAGAGGALTLLPIGRKAGDYFKHAQASGAADAPGPDGMRAVFSIGQGYPLEEAQAGIIAGQLCERFRKGQVDQVDIFYAHCKSTLRQIPARIQFLPITPPAGEVLARTACGRLFEPALETMADDLFLRYLATCVRQVLIEEQLSEHSARMVMMDQASKNASDMIARIQMNYNTLRQEMITGELSDITTGVEAMA